MPQVLVQHVSRAGGVRITDTIFDEMPHRNSLAALILLKNILRQHDVDYLSDIATRYKKIAFSRNYLTKEKEVHGDLICTYCHTPHLHIEYEGMRVNHDIKATIDHIVPLSQGGEFFNEKNVCVACGVCNSRKGSMPAEEFKEIVKTFKYYKPV